MSQFPLQLTIIGAIIALGEIHKIADQIAVEASMKELLVGLLVIVMVLVLSGLGLILFPLFLLMGIFLRLILGIVLVIFAIWAIGKVTLFLMELIANKEPKGK